MADTTSEEERTWRLGFFLSTKYVGNILGLILQGIYLKRNMFGHMLLLDVILFCVITLLTLAFVLRKIKCKSKIEENYSTICQFQATFQ